MNAQINVSLFRVSADGDFLDIIIDCPRGYLFTEFKLTAKYRIEKQDYSDTFDIGNNLFLELKEVKDNDEFVYELSKKHHWVIRIPIEELGISVPAIYIGKFNAKKIPLLEETSESESDSLVDSILEDVDVPEFPEHTPEDDDWDPSKPGEEDAVHHIMHEVLGPDELPEVDAICSDVNNVYNNLLDGVINLTGTCDKVSDDTIRVYLILYAHLEAMRLGHIDDAMLYFNMINNNFNRCGNFSRSGSGPSCGCAKAATPKPASDHKSGGSSCGCGR